MKKVSKSAISVGLRSKKCFMDYDPRKIYFERYFTLSYKGKEIAIIECGRVENGMRNKGMDVKNDNHIKEYLIGKIDVRDALFNRELELAGINTRWTRNPCNLVNCGYEDSMGNVGLGCGDEHRECIRCGVVSEHGDAKHCIHCEQEISAGIERVVLI